MLDFFYNILDSIEAFFASNTAAIIGTGFIIAVAVVIYIMLHYFDKNN
ncbi:MAG: hypothetical protein IJO86_03650 [Oscillospiraceae bacterium]|nr:hypothetical protein [Oscillospiraceae bacterium]